MLNDKRRATRRAMRYTAWIGLDDGKLLGCALSDVSDTGCRLDVEEAAAVPQSFTLLLSRRGFPKRLCKVVWRADNQVGIAFDRNLIGDEIKAAPPKPAGAVIETIENAPPTAPGDATETVDIEAPAEKA